MYDGIPVPGKPGGRPLGPRHQPVLDAIVNGDARNMEFINDGVASLVVTSPPYNVGKEYDENLSLDDYLDFLDEAWKECYRILGPGGRLCINITGVGRKPYIPLPALVTTRVLETGFFMRGEIIWNKGASVGSSTAWGSWCSPSNPVLRDVHEHVMVFSKDSMTLEKGDRDPDITATEFMECTKSVWNFRTENASSIGHPAPFPIELPSRLIKLYTYPGDIVVDPFCGSGTTCLAAKIAGRHYIGVDVNGEYCELARKRLAHKTFGW